MHAAKGPRRFGVRVVISIATLLLISCGGSGGGSSGGGNPTSPSTTPGLGTPGGLNLAGTWSGSFARVNGSPIALVWTATQDNVRQTIAGPLNLTISGVTGTGTLEGNLGQAPGGTTGTFAVTFFTVNIPAGGMPGFPNCQITSAGSSPNATVSATTFTSSAFTLKYFGCRGLIDQEFGSTVQEPAQVTLANTPNAVPPPTAGTERWVGVAPDGMLLEPGPGACTLDLDLTLELVPSGTTLIGTAVTRERRTAAGCSGLGQVDNWVLSRGTLGSGTISFRIGGDTQPLDFTGTFTATRMSGTVLTFGGRHGTFAVTRQ